jgi:hypothetical protein
MAGAVQAARPPLTTEQGACGVLPPREAATWAAAPPLASDTARGSRCLLQDAVWRPLKEFCDVVGSVACGCSSSPHVPVPLFLSCPRLRLMMQLHVIASQPLESCDCAIVSGAACIVLGSKCCLVQLFLSLDAKPTFAALTPCCGAALLLVGIITMYPTCTFEHPSLRVRAWRYQGLLQPLA